MFAFKTYPKKSDFYNDFLQVTQQYKRLKIHGDKLI